MNDATRAPRTVDVDSVLVGALIGTINSCLAEFRSIHEVIGRYEYEQSDDRAVAAALSDLEYIVANVRDEVDRFVVDPLAGA
jgi:hypothetical protein